MLNSVTVCIHCAGLHLYSRQQCATDCRPSLWKRGMKLLSINAPHSKQPPA